MLSSSLLRPNRMSRSARIRASTNKKRTKLDRDNRAIRRALRILESHARTAGDPFVSRSYAAEWFRLRLARLPHEVFAVAWLDTRHRLIEFRELFTGTVDSATVHLREVARSALDCNA